MPRRPRRSARRSARRKAKRESFSVVARVMRSVSSAASSRHRAAAARVEQPLRALAQDDEVHLPRARDRRAPRARPGWRAPAGRRRRGRGGCGGRAAARSRCRPGSGCRASPWRRAGSRRRLRRGGRSPPAALRRFRGSGRRRRAAFPWKGRGRGACRAVPARRGSRSVTSVPIPSPGRTAIRIVLPLLAMPGSSSSIVARAEPVLSCAKSPGREHRPCCSARRAAAARPPPSPRCSPHLPSSGRRASGRRSRCGSSCPSRPGKRPTP